VVVPGDAGHDRFDGGFTPLGGKAAGPGQTPAYDPYGALEIGLVGVEAGFGAARQIRALTA
jgi:hypothetical protein